MVTRILKQTAKIIFGPPHYTTEQISKLVFQIFISEKNCKSSIIMYQIWVSPPYFPKRNKKLVWNETEKRKLTGS